MVIHKIVVAHGAKEACLAASDVNVYGSLAISYGGLTRETAFPFFVELDKQRPVHVLDSHNLPIILTELDTFSDLSAYFDAKSEAIEQYDFLQYCGEEDLLAHYFSNFDSKRKRHFIGTKDKTINSVLIGEGEWKDFQQSDVYRRRKEADRESYLWDSIIQITSLNTLNDKILGNSNPLRGKSAIHEMAREPRFARRALASGMNRAVKSFPDRADETAKVTRNVTLMRSLQVGKAYVFLQLHMNDKGDYENDYRPKRRALLEIACGSAKNKFSDLQTIVGIAIDAPKFARENAEDFLLMECTDWPDELRERYLHANKGLNFFTTPNLQARRVRTRAFPEKPNRKSGVTIPEKIGRNQLCPCGSGLKYKKCCLRN